MPQCNKDYSYEGVVKLTCVWRALVESTSSEWECHASLELVRQWKERKYYWLVVLCHLSQSFYMRPLCWIYPQRTLNRNAHTVSPNIEITVFSGSCFHFLYKLNSDQPGRALALSRGEAQQACWQGRRCPTDQQTGSCCQTRAVTLKHNSCRIPRFYFILKTAEGLRDHVTGQNVSLVERVSLVHVLKSGAIPRVYP